jgi:hypothetical protein
MAGQRSRLQEASGQIIEPAVPGSRVILWIEQTGFMLRVFACTPKRLTQR